MVVLGYMIYNQFACTIPSHLQAEFPQRTLFCAGVHEHHLNTFLFSDRFMTVLHFSVMNL
jgi:hypothetical protein